jgi:hypothetical protein
MATSPHQLEEPLADRLNRQRVIDNGDVFTPANPVNDMLDLVAQECERIDSRFLEPACGNRNFLAEVPRHKLNTVIKNHARNREKIRRYAIMPICDPFSDAGDKSFQSHKTIGRRYAT